MFHIIPPFEIYIIIVSFFLLFVKTSLCEFKTNIAIILYRILSLNKKSRSKLFRSGIFSVFENLFEKQFTYCSRKIDGIWQDLLGEFFEFQLKIKRIRISDLAQRSACCIPVAGSVEGREMFIVRSLPVVIVRRLPILRSSE